MQLSETLATAVQMHRSGQLPEAEKRYRQILAEHPDHADANHLLGLLAYQGGFADEAIALISRAIAADPGQAMFHNSLGLALRDKDRLSDGISAFKQAVSINPDYAEAQANLALALLADGQTRPAIDHFEKAAKLAPDNLDTLGNLGNAYKSAGDLEAAVECYRKIIAAAPQHAAAHGNLGVALQQLGHFDEAKAAYQSAIASDSGYLEAYNNLGLLYQASGDPDKAVRKFRAALERDPNFAEAHSNLGVALQQQGQPEQAMVHLKKALALAPNHAKAHANLGTALLELGHAQEAVASFEQALSLQPRFPTAFSNLMLGRLYLADTDPADNLRLAQQINVQLSPLAPAEKAFDHDPDPDRPLRVGFVSSDLRRHAVSSFLESLWPELTSDGLGLYAYATSPIEDAVSERLKRAVTGWRNLAGQPPRRKADQIRADKIDILIDLGGHTAGNNLDVFALKPAPVQVGWLGYSATTGLATMDYILGDPWVTPAEDAAQYSETIWRLPDSYLCFSPPRLQLPVAPTPALKNGHLTFGSFNNLTKLTDEAIACWVRILDSDPDSRLLLKAKQLDYPAYRRQLLDRFVRQGGNPDQLVMLERTSGLEDHFRTYNKIDIALDPFPYCGTTTTSEALWMGVPVLSLKGDRFVARVGESLLQNCGLADWIAASPAELIGKAQMFSRDLQALDNLRQSLRGVFLASPACDAPRFAGDMSKALRDMWQNWCAGQP